MMWISKFIDILWSCITGAGMWSWISLQRKFRLGCNTYIYEHWSKIKLEMEMQCNFPVGFFIILYNYFCHGSGQYFTTLKDAWLWLWHRWYEPKKRKVHSKQNLPSSRCSLLVKTGFWVCRCLATAVSISVHKAHYEIVVKIDSAPNSPVKHSV